jgi:hypothetical protein
MSEVDTALSELNVNKGPGDDSIPPSIMKLCSDGLKFLFLYIFNLSLSSGTFIKKWKDSFLVSIFKTGTTLDITEAILSCFAKLFEVIVYSRMFFSVKSFSTPHQHGFFSGSSKVTMQWKTVYGLTPYTMISQKPSIKSITDCC